jgi:hypothetical protein
MSEAIEESGVKVFMPVLALGIGSARRRFESMASGMLVPSGINHFNTMMVSSLAVTIPLRWRRGNLSPLPCAQFG